jgi:hypothetical protein
MSEPRRLLEEGADDLRAELLRSALGDQMPSASLRRALAVAAVASSTVAAAGSASAAAGGSAAAATIVKWIGIGMVAGTVTAGGAKLVTSALQTPAASTTAREAIHRQPQTVLDQSVRAPHVTPERATSAVEPRPEAAEPRANASARRGELPAVPSSRGVPEAVLDPERTAEQHLSPADVLRRELSLIDEARHAVASGHAQDGLRALDRYDLRYPQGRFGPEATALRVEALLKLGRRAQAVALSDALLRTAPTSPAAARVRRLLETPP